MLPIQQVVNLLPSIPNPVHFSSTETEGFDLKNFRPPQATGLFLLAKYINWEALGKLKTLIIH